MNETGSPANVGSMEGLGVGANLQRDPYRLDFVLMPMVKMLAEQELSWSQREQVAHAMLATMRHHKSMTDEMQMHCASAQQQCQGMTIGQGLKQGEIAAIMKEQRASRITPAPHA